jgi:hypothetical protein
MTKRCVTKVPNARVPALVKLFERTGATKVDVKDNGDNTSDVCATFPAEETHSAFKARLAKAVTPK